MKAPFIHLSQGDLHLESFRLDITALHKMICLLALFSGLGLQTYAQVNTYTFAAFSGTYVTVPSPTTVHASGWDDNTAVSVTIPFNYIFNGIGYTTCSVNCNGYVTFGATTSTAGTYLPISQTTGYAGAISALGRDLISNSSTITYGVTASAPNRIFIIQWNNARRYSGAAITGDVFNFQIRLYETTNYAEVMYGTCTVTSGTDLFVQVGLRGTANTDYKNLSILNNGFWNAPGLGTANGNTCVTGNTAGELPGSGLMYRWSPPTCAGTPTAPTAAISPGSGVAGAAFSGTYTGGTTGSPITNQWQYSYDNVNFTDWAAQTASPLAGSAQSTIYLRDRRTCPTTGLSSTSNVVTYTVTSWNLSSNGTGNTCSGTFYDSGGSGGAYVDNQDYTYTFYPGTGTTGQKVRLTFTAFSTEDKFDGMMIYNGNSTAAAIISSGLSAAPADPNGNPTNCPAGSFRGTGSPGTVTSTAADGSLTIRFRSDGGVTSTGWAATITCFNPCTIPTLYSVTGGGTRCTSGAALAVGLSNSQVNVSYQLKLNGTNTGSPVAGTNAAISFTTQTAAGTYTVDATGTGGGFCTSATAMTGSVAITVDPLPVLGTLNNAGPVVTCDHAGNIAQVSLSGFTGTPSWEYGDAANNFTVWGINTANAGTCCFVPNPGADRIRVKVSSGTCGSTAYSSTVLIQNKNAPAPASVTSTATSYCLASRPANITLTATFPASGDMLPTVAGYTTVNFYSGSCAGTLVGAGTISGNTATLTITAPSATTTYFALSTSGCETSTCASVTVTVSNIPAQPTGFTGVASPCSGSSQAYSVTNVAGVTYGWAFPGTGWSITNGSGTNAITVSVGSGTGNIIVTPSNGCGAGTTLTSAVSTSAGPTVSISPSSASACGGVGVSLAASGASTYSWSPATGLSATTGATVTANPASNTTYTVTETGSGCNNTATVIVKAGSIVTATANASASSVCPGAAINLSSSAANGTVTALSPTGDGGFETGTTFAANGWTTVNAATNIWQIGNLAPAFAGSRGAHISSNGTVYSYSSTNNVARTSHLYKDVAISSGATNISLSFYWKGNGELTWDRLLVYTAPTSVTPVVNVPASVSPAASTTLTGATLVWTQTAFGGSYAQATVPLPASLAGTTVRLIFTWQNDNSTGSIPIAIDNVGLTYTPAAGTYTYSWTSSPAGFTSSAQNPTANPVVATTYTVVATNTASGCSDPASTATVNMNAVPQGSLTASTPVCTGDLVSLTWTSTAGTGPFTVNYNPSAQSNSGVVSGTPFSSNLATSLGTNTYTLTSVTDANGCTRSSAFTGGFASTTAVSAPTAPTAPTSTYNCSTGAVTLSTSGAGAGESYKWYTVSSGGSPVSTGSASFVVTPTNSTNYYAAKYYTSGGSCESPRVSISAFADGLETYTASRTTGVALTDISGSASVPVWRNGTSDDNLSNNLNIGFSFPFDGATYTQFKISSDGFITLNAATTSTGSAVMACGDAENYSNDNTTFSDFAKLGTVQSIAPFYDDLLPHGQTFANSFHYRTDVSPNRLTVQWRGMSKYVDESSSSCSPSCAYGNYNFQVVLYETGNIEFNYGTMTNTADESSKNYTTGINSSTISSPLNTAKLFTQQTHNTASFSSNPVNNLSTVPATNSRITLTRTAPIVPTQVPACIAYNFPANGATNQCTNSALSWSPVDGIPTGYDLYFGTNNPPTNIVNGTTQSSTWYAPTFSSNTTYFWRVVPRNAIGAAVAANMPVWSFSTGATNVVNSITSSAGTNLCVGATTTLTPNGSLAEGSVYDWTLPFTLPFVGEQGCTDGIPYPSIFALITNPYACEAGSPTITYSSAGTYKYDVFAKGCNGITSCARITITVNNNANTAPTSISSSAGTTICAGTSTILTPAGGTLGAGATYEWFTGSCGSTVIATTSAITVSPASTITYFVRRTGGTTCANTTTCTSLAITVQAALGNNTISSAQTICTGASPATLTGTTPTGGNGTYAYDWFVSTTSASAGFASLGSNTINYSPGALSQDTWYKRTVTSGTCTTPNESAVIKITVTPTVGTPSFTAGATTLCIGGTSTYTATVTDGTVSYSATGGASINSSTGVISSVASNFTVTATGAGCSGPTTATRSVTVTPNVSTPSFTAGATTLCIGGTSTYTATVSNGTVSYSVTGGASINSGTGVISSVISDFTVTATGTGCNGPTTATRSVTVTPNVGTPSFTAGATTLCVGASDTYTATVSNGTVSYSVTGGASIHSTTGVVSSVTGNFTVTATGAGCNGPTSATRSVTVTPTVGTPAFTAGATTLCAGGTSTYTATVSNGTVAYSVTGGASIDANTGVVSGVTGNFTVTATGTGCNGPSTATRSVTVNPVLTPSVTIAANPGTTVCVGTNIDFTATPVNGGGAPAYQWQVNGSNAGTGATFSSSPANNDVVSVRLTSNATCASPTTANDQETITAIGSYAINATAGANGTVTFAGITSVACNGSQSYTITPASSCYVVNDVTVDGVSIGAATTYNFTNVNADHTISATFSLLTYTINASAGSNGSISPNGNTVVNCGADQTYAITPAAGYVVQSVLVDGSPVGPVTSYTFTNVAAGHTISATFVPGGPTQWTAGVLTTDWYTPGNWSNGVPTAVTDALVPVVVSNIYPVIVGLAGAFTKNLTIDAGASVTLSFSMLATIPQSELEVNGTFTNNGAVDMGAGYLTIKGPSIAGHVLVKYLKINNVSGVALVAGASVGVKGELTLQSGTFTTTGGSLTLVSDAASTGYVNDWGANAGNIASGNSLTIERYIPAGVANGFHYIGSASGGNAAMWNDNFTNIANAVDGTPVTPKPNCDPLHLASGSAYGNLFSYDESLVTDCYLSGWRVNSASHAAHRGEGFAATISAGTVLNETGAYTNSNVQLSGLSITATNTITGIIGGSNSKSFHMVANPFFAPLDWNAMMSINPGINLDHTAYIFDPVAGSYKYYNQITSGIYTGSYNGPIASNMGFFVKANNTSSGTFSITFDKDARTTGNNGNFMRQGQPFAYALKITAASVTHADETLVAFDATFTDGYDNGYDADKLANSRGLPSLYTRDVTNISKAIEALGINTEVKSVPLGLLVPGASGSYTLTFNGVEDFPATTIIWLEDLNTGTIQYLRQDSTYAFTANETDNPDRFVIHFAPELLITTGIESCDGNDANISLIQRGGIEWAFRLMDGNNSVVTSDIFNSGELINHLSQGTYTLNLTHPASGYATSITIIVNGLQPVQAVIDASSTLVLENEAITLNAVTTGATYYVWDMGDGNTIMNQQSVSHSYTQEGTYEVTLFASNDSCNAEATQFITVHKQQDISTGIAMAEEGSITIYASGYQLFVIQKLNRTDVLASVEVFNDLGQRIYMNADAVLAYNKAHVITIRVPSEIYFVRVKTAEGGMMSKVHLGE